jgi:hypothetical protein
MMVAGACSAAILGVLSYSGRSALYDRGVTNIRVYPMLAICAVGGLIPGGLIGLLVGRLVLALGSFVPALAEATSRPWSFGYVSLAIWPGGVIGGALGMLLGFIRADAKHKTPLASSQDHQAP